MPRGSYHLFPLGVFLMEKKEKKFDIEFDDWQQKILAAKGHVLLCTGRQVGKTTIFATKCAERMVKEPNTKIVAVSLTEDQAFLMRAIVEDYLKAKYPAYLKVPKKAKPTKNKITLNNGSTYIVRPVGNTGDAVRGFTSNVLVVDEAAYMPELMWAAAKPTLLTTGGDVWMCSTPHGKEGYFYECFQNKHNHFTVFHVNSEEVMQNRQLTEKWTENKRAEALRFLEEEKANMSELRYAQEYLGQFVDELRQYFSDAWIESVCTARRPEVMPHNQDYYMGVDIARMGGDENAFEVMMRTKDEMIHVYSETAKRWLTTMTEQRIIDLSRTFHELKKIYIDAGAGSLGVGVFDHLMQNDETKRKVEAINNRKLVMDRDGKSKQRLLKEDLYDNLKSLGEKGALKLLNDENVRLSLKSIQYEFVKKPSQMSQMRIFGNYSHIVEGLIRAAWGVKEKNIKISITSFKI